MHPQMLIARNAGGDVVASTSVSAVAYWRAAGSLKVGERSPDSRAGTNVTIEGDAAQTRLRGSGDRSRARRRGSH
jgi:hypothetical protein